jgi:hypothetical protein
MEFQIRSKSSGSEYTIKVYGSEELPIIDCSCTAGEMGQSCKHRFALLNGDESEVYDATHPVEDLTARIAGTQLGTCIQNMSDHEKAIADAQAELKRLKKKVAKAMNGIIT